MHFLVSALAGDSPLMPNSCFNEWFDERAERHRFVIEQVPFAKLDRWEMDREQGCLLHASGKFFSVGGLRVRQNAPVKREWDQPILHQPEIGILGFLAKKFDGVLHFLAQAKMEPGNINYIQLSPTVQATRSNYTKVHQGRTPHYLEYFLDASRGRVLVDSLQSEQGGRFFRKRNRNIVVETSEDVAVLEDHRWLTLGQMFAMLRRDNVINMDARTVLSCIPLDVRELSGAGPAEMVRTIENKCGVEAGRLTRPDTELEAALLRTLVQPLDTRNYAEDMQWLTAQKFLADQQVESIRLQDMRDWQVDEKEVSHSQGKYFKVIGVRVEASNREVPAWCQPIVQPCSVGLMSYFVRINEERVEVLVQTKCEPGNADVLEIGPAVQCFPADIEVGEEPAFLAESQDQRCGQRLVDTLQSEEGGRFFREGNRNQIILVDEGFAENVPDGYRWIRLNHLKHMINHSNLLNVEARCLLASLGIGAVQEPDKA